MTEAANDSAVIRVRYQPVDEDVSSAAEELRSAGASDVEEDRNGAGVIDLAVAGFVVVASMAVTAFVAWLKGKLDDRNKRGVLIKVDEEGEVAVTELNIPANQVIVIAPTGQTAKYLNANDEASLSDIASALSKGLLPAGGTPTTADEVSKAKIPAK